MQSLKALHMLLTVVMADSDMLEIMKMFQSFTIDFFSHSYVSPNVRIFSFVPSVIYISWLALMQLTVVPENLNSWYCQVADVSEGGR